MKLDQKISIILLTAGMAVLAWKGNAQTPEDEIQVARRELKADRKAAVAEALQFTEAGGQSFLAALPAVSGRNGQIGRRPAQADQGLRPLYPNVPDDRAKAMLNELGNLEKQLVETRNSYLKKIQKVISPAKTLRFAQVESRLDLALRMGMAATSRLFR